MKKLIILTLLALIVSTGCKKFLEQKPDKKLAIPESLTDLQSLFNNFNYNANDPSSGEISADDYYLEDAVFNALRSETDQRKYTWEKDHLFDVGGKVNDWSYQYDLIYLANTVLEKLKNIERNGTNAAEYDNVKGQAYFNRARGYYNALTIWSVAYDKKKASSTLGVVIRDGTDFNKPSVRSSTETGYQYVLSDFRQAVNLLPVGIIYPSRPAKQAAYGYIARVLLSMGNFPDAGHYADSCLTSNLDLMDYNEISPTKRYPFPQYNTEVIYESGVPTPTILSNSRARIATDLYASYADNDLRKSLFFKDNNNGTYGWRGAYLGSSGVYSALCIDEILLIRAECYARTGNTVSALADINLLLSNRYKVGTFIPIKINGGPELTSLIVKERRKELLMRNLRWMDLKRLNILGNDINLQRISNGKTYTLPANDPRYALEIPEDIIEQSGIPQNIR